MKPRLVAFDLGKVLVDFDYRVSARKVAARAQLPASRIQPILESSDALKRMESGQTSSEQFFREVCDATGFSGPFEEFRDLFADIFWPIEPMIELHGRLRQRGVPTYIFSNTNDMAVSHIRRRFPFYSQFTGYIYSFEVRAMKPTRPIYEALERMASRRGAEILYLDDRLENVDGGRACGWQVIHHQSSELTLAQVRALGLD
jgi:HAD superfamily hydrolase (TIGR01509 family)